MSDIPSKGLLSREKQTRIFDLHPCGDPQRQLLRVAGRPAEPGLYQSRAVRFPDALPPDHSAFQFHHAYCGVLHRISPPGGGGLCQRGMHTEKAAPPAPDCLVLGGVDGPVHNPGILAYNHDAGRLGGQGLTKKWHKASVSGCPTLSRLSLCVGSGAASTHDNAIAFTAAAHFRTVRISRLTHPDTHG